MITNGLTQVRDEVMTTFKDAWEADSLSNDLPVLYPDTADEPPSSGAWARVTMRHVTGRQATLSNEIGARRYRKAGFIIVQVFSPAGQGLTLCDELTTIAIRAFEGVTTTPGRVAFTNVRSNEVGRDGAFYQVNVLADFEYDEVR